MTSFKQNVLQHILTWFPPALHVPSQTYASGSQRVLASPRLPLRLLSLAVLLQISVTQETMPPKCFLFRGKIEHYGTRIEHTVKRDKCDMRDLMSVFLNMAVFVDVMLYRWGNTPRRFGYCCAFIIGVKQCFK